MNLLGSGYEPIIMDDMPDNPMPSPAESRWKFIERTVAVLEHLLAPGARVLHNQMLRELASGIPRQS